MNAIKTGMAGTLESSDIMVTIEPNPEPGLVIYLQSTVEKQFGNQIRKVINDTLASLDLSDVIVHANDKGALDCVIKARVQAAALRASDEKQFNWKKADQ
jgi:citrate lyase subunit gamma (acyl carrier protein)